MIVTVELGLLRVREILYAVFKDQSVSEIACIYAARAKRLLLRLLARRTREREKKAEKSGGIEDAVHPSRRMRVPGGK